MQPVIHTAPKSLGIGEVRPATPRLLSELSTTHQLLVRLCQSMNYGHIQRLEVKDSEPIFTPETLVLVEVKLDGDDGARPEVGLADFALPDEVCRLMARLDQIQHGTIEKIEVRAGVARRLVFSASPSGVLR
jgi:hypothetical protein